MKPTLAIWILVVGDVLTLTLAVASYFFPQLADLRAQLWGVFAGYNSGLLVALNVRHDNNATPVDPAPPSAPQA
jgi:hypothetical protein